MSKLLYLLAAMTLAALMLFVAACDDDDDGGDVPGEPVAGEYDVNDQPDDAAAAFDAPADGDTVTSPVAVTMRAEGVEIVAAGVPAVGEGHFHINVDLECVAEGEAIPGPSDEATAQGHRHFGDGSTEASLELEPGEHELCIQLADGTHIAYGETETITITVE